MTTTLAAELAHALDGRRLTNREARELSRSIRRVTTALPPGTGPMAVLSRDLIAAADLLDAQANHRRRPR